MLHDHDACNQICMLLNFRNQSWLPGMNRLGLFISFVASLSTIDIRSVFQEFSLQICDTWCSRVQVMFTCARDVHVCTWCSRVHVMCTWCSRVQVMFTCALFRDVFCFSFVRQGLIDQLQKYKLLFIETTDAAETTLALANYQKVCIYLLIY